MKCETLDVWKRSCRLSVELYQYFSESKGYGFKDQISRCSLSTPSNIAEGMEKNSDKEKNRFIEIAKDSASELSTKTFIGIERNYIEKNKGLNWTEELNEILSVLTGLANQIKGK